MLKASADPKLLLSWVLMFLYTAAVVAVLHRAGLWTAALLKDTVLWFCFTGIVLVVSLVSSEYDKSIVRRVVADNVKLIVFIQFLVNTYTFSLPVELALVPLVAVVVTLDTLAQAQQQYSAVARLTRVLLALIGLAVVLSAVVRAVADYRALGSFATARRVLLPLLLSVSFVPFIYLLMLAAAYDTLFLRLRLGAEPDAVVQRYAKRRIMFHCGPSLTRVRQLLRVHAADLMRVQRREDVDHIVDSREASARRDP